MSLPEPEQAPVTSDTGKNRRPGTFKPGDVRINRKGRPKTFDKLRALAVQVAGEANEAGVTRIMAMMREMAVSKNAADRKLFLEYAYGKVPEKVDLSVDEIVVTLKGKDDER